jgi:hypothetical protein
VSHPVGDAPTLVTRTAKIWLGAEGIVHLQPHARREQTLADAIENVEAVNQLSGKVKRGLLVHFQEAVAQTPDCRAYYMSEPAGHTLTGVAIVTSSMLGRVVGNLMLGMNRTGVPVRLFESDEAAAKWLKGRPAT